MFKDPLEGSDTPEDRRGPQFAGEYAVLVRSMSPGDKTFRTHGVLSADEAAEVLGPLVANFASLREAGKWDAAAAVANQYHAWAISPTWLAPVLMVHRQNGRHIEFRASGHLVLTVPWTSEEPY